MQDRASVASLVAAGSVLLGSVLPAAGCASSSAPHSSTSRSPAASRTPAASSTAATAAELKAMAGTYMAIAQPANRELDQLTAASPR
jgi:hypothetical protein